MESAPRVCGQVDDRVFGWGEKWVCDDRPVDLNGLLSAREMAERFGLNVHNVRDWARRHPDRIRTYRKGRKTLFSVREVISFVSTAHK